MMVPIDLSSGKIGGVGNDIAFDLHDPEAVQWFERIGRGLVYNQYKEVGVKVKFALNFGTDYLPSDLKDTLTENKKIVIQDVFEYSDFRSPDSKYLGFVVWFYKFFDVVLMFERQD